MTSELRHSESISEFTCGGPKNYAHKLVDTVTGASRTVCKVRGITQLQRVEIGKFRCHQGHDFEGDEPPVINVHTQKRIKRKRKGRTVSIVTEPEDKIYRISFFKRRRLGDNTSVPFGYK